MNGESGQCVLKPGGCLSVVVLATFASLAMVGPQPADRLPRPSASRSRVTAQAAATTEDPDELYRRRQELSAARRAADLWALRAGLDYESAWKLARVCYRLGTAGATDERRGALERGVKAGESAARLQPSRPEGHFWYAANMGMLAQLFGSSQGLKYRGKIKEELERVLAIDPAWQDGSADAALGQWYFKVPRLLGGSRSKAEEHLRRALMYDPNNRMALSELADVVAASGRRDEAVELLHRLIAAPIHADWIPEDTDFERRAVERLKTLER
jgi:tetratricopeptide (TPR) repeat protein